MYIHIYIYIYIYIHIIYIYIHIIHIYIYIYREREKEKYRGGPSSPPAPRLCRSNSDEVLNCAKSTDRSHAQLLLTVVSPWRSLSHTHTHTRSHTHTHTQTWYTRMYLLYMMLLTIMKLKLIMMIIMMIIMIMIIIMMIMIMIITMIIMRRLLIPREPVDSSPSCGQERRASLWGEPLVQHYLCSTGFLQYVWIMQRIHLALLDKWCRRKQIRPH